MKTTDALKAAQYLWPEFVEHNKFVFFKWCKPEMVDMNVWHDRVEVEATLNHVHVLDLFHHDAGLEVEPFWDNSHPDFISACEFGKVLAHSLACKLAKDFPEKSFRVYYTQNDNPIVRFHQIYENETNWLDDGEFSAEIDNAQLMVLEVVAS